MTERPDPNDQIRANIQRFREELGMAQADLALESGLDLDAVRRVENGKGAVDAVFLRAIGPCLNRRLDEFFEENPAPAAPVHRPVYYVRVRRGAEFTQELHEQALRVIAQLNEEERRRQTAAPPPTVPRSPAKEGVKARSRRKAR